MRVGRRARVGRRVGRGLDVGLEVGPVVGNAIAVGDCETRKRVAGEVQAMRGAQAPSAATIKNPRPSSVVLTSRLTIPPHLLGVTHPICVPEEASPLFSA